MLNLQSVLVHTYYPPSHALPHTHTHTHTQNDPGTPDDDTGVEFDPGHFATYMKARIFCEVKVPSVRLEGAIDYQYNEIRE